MASAGVADHVRAAWLGHSRDINVRVYTHASQADMATAGAAMAVIFGAA